MLQIKNLCKNFNNHEVLHNINIVINDGESVVIIGKSGVGKSVLLKLILGIIKPTSGEVWINNFPIHKLTNQDMLDAIKDVRMGFLFQESALFDYLTIYENTRFYLDYHKIKDEEYRYNTAVNCLERVGLKNYMFFMPSEISGGMAKRAAIARIMSYKPKIMIFDEPTSGLDPITSKEIIALIKDVAKESNSTCIIVTHDIYCAEELGKRVFLHKNKNINEIFNLKEFFCA